MVTPERHHPARSPASALRPAGNVAAVHELGPFETHYATNGMVCSVDHVASAAGVAMLRAGGSAADAAVATSAVLAVTAPHMCGLGGDLFALVFDSTGPPVALNASGRAGSGADAARLRADGHQRMPRRGDIRSVPVPGCVDGWLALHDRFGRLPLVDVLEPARRLADDGFAVSPLLSLAALLVEGGAGEGTDLLLGGRPDAGAIRRRPGTARALADIARSGRAGFYEGAFGEGLLALGDGEYVTDDLGTPLADWVTPISARAWEHDVWTVPPNSQGYLALSASAIAAGLDLPDDPDDPDWAHLLVESAKQASFDRNSRLWEHADGAALLDPADLAARRAAIDPRRASDLTAPTDDGGTIFLCAADASGMGVSLIQSNAADFGAHLVEPNTGTFLHNRGIGFSLLPGHPAEYGPGRRPPSTLSPTLVTDPRGRCEPWWAPWVATPNHRWCSSCWPACWRPASRRARW